MTVFKQKVRYVVQVLMEGAEGNSIMHIHTGYPSAPSGGTCMTYLASSWNSIFHMLSHNSAIEFYHFIPLDLGYSYLCEFCYKFRSDLHHRRLIKPDRNLFYQPQRS